MKKVIPLLFLLFTFLNSFSQSDCSCCTEVHQQFDFWVGSWIVYDTTGKEVGRNTIKRIEDQCALMEEWKGGGGSTGSSINYFNSSDSSWNQVWVDNQGNVLELKGGMKGNSMVLRSELIKGKQGTYYNQIKWTPHEDKSVRQVWKIHNKEGQELRTLFIGIYRK